MACKYFDEHEMEAWREITNLMVIKELRVCLKSEKRVLLPKRKGS